MKTPPEDAALIAASLEYAAEHGDPAAEVYARLFRDRPELEPLFVMDTNGAVRGEMLARVFDAILDLIGPRAYAHNLIAAEATTHEGYLVSREDFIIFFRIVRDTVCDACGERWGAPTEAAWQRLLGDLAGYVDTTT